MENRQAHPRPATQADLGPALELLGRADLPLAGVEEHFAGFVVLEGNDGLLGVAGVERYGTDVLLRSVAVDERARKGGAGSALTRAVLARASAEGVRRAYLLTTTAEDFFARRGFRVIARKAVPDAVRQSVEFREACPDTAVAMVRELDGIPTARRPD
jgi:amino-acid N-acetyltransferase